MNPLKIINYIRRSGLTKTEFCKRCKIKTLTLDAIIYYDKIVPFYISERIAEAMGMGVYELFTF